MGLRVTPFRRGRVPLVVALTLLLSGCFNTERIFHGAAFTPKGDALMLAALMPSCACTTISSRHPADDIELVARLHGIAVGEIVIKPGNPIRFRFDWAGPTNADVYELSAYSIEQGKRGRALVPIRDHIELEHDIVDIPCGSTTCPFGALHLNRAWAEQLGQGAAETYAVGVTMIHGGQSIAANTLPGTCGCMLLRNRTDTVLQLRSRLHGRERGQLVFPAHGSMVVGFDFAGDNPDDAYVIEGTAAPMPGVPSDTTPALLTLSDYLAIVGAFNGLDCPSAAPMDSVRLEIDGTAAACPFGALNMNERMPANPPSATAAPTGRKGRP